jgi:molybdopterin synthase catalytic subunit
VESRRWQMNGLVDAPLDTARLIENLRVPAGASSVAAYIGVVKPVRDGKRTRGLTITRVGSPEVELQELEDVLLVKWRLEHVVLLRRMGELAVGDVVAMVAVVAPDRKAAFGALADACEGFENMTGLSKEEHFEE